MESGTVAENRFGKYMVPPGVEQRPAARAVLDGRVYELRTIEFMRANAADGDIIHAGTFFGDFLPALSTAMAPGARIWAFEPNPGSCAAARATIALNQLENVTLTNAALSDRSDSLHFRTHSTEGVPQGGISKVVGKPGPGVIEVAAAMLDYAVPLDRKVTILQLDVEGQEIEAMLGAFHMIHRWTPILILEDFTRDGWIERNFRNLGYVRVGRLHGNYVFATKKKASQLSMAGVAAGTAETEAEK